MKKIDWHSHTLEGSNEGIHVGDVVREAKEAELYALAITDHNSISAISSAEKYAGEDLIIIPGVELDAVIEGKRGHIFCFYPEHGTYEFQEELSALNSRREKRMLDTARRFEEKGLISDSELAVSELEATQGSLTRIAVANTIIRLYSGTDTLIGKEIASLSEVEDGQDMTTRFLKKFIDKKSDSEISCYIGYEPQYSVDYSDVSSFCRKHKGVFGFAHLLKDIPDREKAEKAFEKGLDMGMSVLGIGHPDHSSEDIMFLEHLAARGVRDRRINGKVIGLNGTDYHAKKGQPSLGEIYSGPDTLEKVMEYSRLLRG